MTCTQIVRYLENRDASSISYRRFNQTPRDRYPTYSFCFTGTSVNWFNDLLMFNELGITPAHYENILKGEIGYKYDYQRRTRLYKKVPLDIRNISGPGLERFSLNASNILKGFEFIDPSLKLNEYYGKHMNANSLKPDPLYISHQTPDTICFTRDSNFSGDSIRLQDIIFLERFLLPSKNYDYGLYDDIEFQIILHYPGQLLRTFHKPSYKSTIGLYDKTKVLELKIAMVTLLRKRSNSNVLAMMKL